MYSLVDKTVIVIGGANGIGSGIVKVFLKENIKHVAVIDIDNASGVNLKREMRSIFKKEKITFYNCDVTNIEALFQVFENVVEKYGAIDIAVNSASIKHDGLENFKLQIETNYTGVVSTTLKALEIMRKDKGGKGGTIINVTSFAPLTLGSPSLFVYGSTQSGVLQLTNLIGMEEYYKKTNVRMITICFQPSTNKLFCNNNDSIKGLENFNIMFDEAGQRVVEIFKIGESRSTWIINNNKIHEITEDVRRAYKVMSNNIYSNNDLLSDQF